MGRGGGKARLVMCCRFRHGFVQALTSMLVLPCSSDRDAWGKPLRRCRPSVFCMQATRMHGRFMARKAAAGVRAWARAARLWCYRASSSCPAAQLPSCPQEGGPDDWYTRHLPTPMIHMLCHLQHGPNLLGASKPTTHVLHTALLAPTWLITCLSLPAWCSPTRAMWVRVGRISAFVLYVGTTGQAKLRGFQCTPDATARMPAARSKGYSAGTTDAHACMSKCSDGLTTCT